MASTLPRIVVIAMAAAAFTTAANAEPGCCARSSEAAQKAVQVQPVQVAELRQKKRVMHWAKVPHVRSAKHKIQRPETVVQEPGANSIILRMAPYDFTWV